MKNERELINKLAEFAGFKLKKVQCVGMVYYENEQDCWYYNDKEYGFEPPDFPRSVDACLKWIVPKLITALAHADLSTEEEAYRKLFDEWARVLVKTIEHPSSMITIAHPSLALCAVLLKLIDDIDSKKEVS